MNTPPSFAAARLAALGLLAGLGAEPASAETFTYPGTMCQTDGPVNRPQDGSLLNAASGSTQVTKFHCPIVRTRPASAFGGNLSVTLNVKLNNSLNFDCALRAAMPTGGIVDTANVVIPARTAANDGVFTSHFSISLPPAFLTSVNLRCNVPNFAGEQAGIFSYTVTD